MKKMVVLKKHEEELYQELIDEVIAEIHLGLQERDTEAIEELLRFCPTENLIGYLPEKLHENFKPLLNIF